MKLRTRIAALLPLFTGAAVFAGIMALPPAANAAVIPDCVAAGPSAADVSLAQRLDPGMTGWLNEGGFTPSRAACSRVIVDTVRARGLTTRAATIAITTAIVESRLHNLNHGDRDSLGLYQQRHTQGWGTPAQILDPVHSTGSFLNAMLRHYPDNAWQTAPIGQVCQKVQVSAYESRYQPEAADAARIAAALWTDPVEPPAVVGGSKDFTADGRADVLARDEDGVLWLYEANAAGLMFTDRVRVGSGWNMMSWMYAADVNRDGRPDVVAKDDDGLLWLYKANAAGLMFTDRVRVGSGWNIMSWMAAADADGDGLVDMVARHKNGTLWVYPGTGSSFETTAVYSGSGWNTLDAMLAGDLNGDDRADVVARDDDGKLWLYPSNATGLRYTTRVQVGSGWNIMNGINLTTDSNADGRPDILARERDGKLWLYPNTGGGGTGMFGGPRVYAGSGWQTVTAVI